MRKELAGKEMLYCAFRFRTGIQGAWPRSPRCFVQGLQTPPDVIMTKSRNIRRFQQGFTRIARGQPGHNATPFLTMDVLMRLQYDFQEVLEAQFSFHQQNRVQRLLLQARAGGGFGAGGKTYRNPGPYFLLLVCPWPTQMTGVLRYEHHVQQTNRFD